MYSQAVATTRETARNKHPRTTTRQTVPTRFNPMHATANRISPAAVLTFMLIMPGTTDFNATLSISQPISTTTDAAITTAAR